ARMVLKDVMETPALKARHDTRIRRSGPALRRVGTCALPSAAACLARPVARGGPLLALCYFGIPRNFNTPADGFSMRCLVVADLHYSLPQLDWLVSAAPQFDLLIFAGDALDIGSMVDFRAQIVVVKKYLALIAAQTRIILCSGNHDLDERNAE